MTRTRQRSKANGRASGATAHRFPKIPASRQRRLDELLQKVGEGAISAAERRELKSILDDVDRNTFWGLADMLMRQLERRTRKAAS